MSRLLSPRESESRGGYFPIGPAYRNFPAVVFFAILGLVMPLHSAGATRFVLQQLLLHVVGEADPSATPWRIFGDVLCDRATRVAGGVDVGLRARWPRQYGLCEPAVR